MTDKLGSLDLNRIYCSDAIALMRQMPDSSINCVVTSPPYYNLRNYNADGQIGVESTVAEYIANITAVFREVYRVMRPDATLWLNLGDSYGKSGDKSPGVRNKSLIGIPWRVAFALQDIGFLLRSDIIWSKGNPVPEPVKDRPTRSHEYVFLFSKSDRYFYDPNAIREDNTPDMKARAARGHTRGGKVDGLDKSRNDRQNMRGEANKLIVADGRNARTVWNVNLKRSGVNHYATFPTDLIRPMLLAGCPKQVCTQCGQPSIPIYKRTGGLDMNRPQARRALELASEGGLTEEHFRAIQSLGFSDAGQGKLLQDGSGKNTEKVKRLADEAKAVLGGYFREFTLAKQALSGYNQCACNAGFTAGIVYDPFMGSGTTAVVSRELGLNWIGSDLNPEYCEIANSRLEIPFNLKLF